VVDRSVATLIQPTVYVNYIELYCRKSVAWFLIPLSYNMILMIGCAVLGFLARHLPENFNDSQFIFISVSTTLFVWILFIPAYFTAYYAYLQSVIIGFCLVSNIGVTLGCQFIRIVYAVLFVPTDKIQFNATAIDNQIAPFSNAVTQSAVRSTRVAVKPAAE
jgi:7 transmembrane sweet-taste receptor of 3 GCPR